MNSRIIILDPDQFAEQVEQDFRDDSAAVAAAPATKKQKTDAENIAASLLAINADDLPNDYVHQPTFLATATQEQIERQCAIPAAVKCVQAYWRQRAIQQDKPSAVAKSARTNTTVTHLLSKQFPFDQEEVLRRLARGDPFKEQRLRNRFATARLLGTRLHCYIEVFLRRGNDIIPPALIDGAFRQFLAFWRQCIDANALEPWRIEHTVYGKTCFGSIDALFTRRRCLSCESKDAQVRVYLFDWKRSTHSLKNENDDAQEDATSTRHIVQLDLLRCALHDHYDNTVSVVGMFLCRFHSRNDDEQDSNENSFELARIIVTP